MNGSLIDYQYVSYSIPFPCFVFACFAFAFFFFWGGGCKQWTICQNRFSTSILSLTEQNNWIHYKSVEDLLLIWLIWFLPLILFLFKIFTRKDNLTKYKCILFQRGITIGTIVTFLMVQQKHSYHHLLNFSWAIYSNIMQYYICKKYKTRTLIALPSLHSS